MFNSMYNGLAETLRAQEGDRLERMRRAWDNYYGRMSDTIKVKPGQPDDNVKINFNRLIVDKGVSFLFGHKVEFDIGGDQGETQPDEAAEEWLDQVWEANRKDTLLHKLALNGGVCGTAFLKIQLRPGDVPRLVLVDPETVQVTTAPDDVERIERFVIAYTSQDLNGDPVMVRQTVTRNGQTWLIVDEIGNPKAPMNMWRETGRSVWPYAFPPIFCCQNLPAPSEFWGVSDLEDDVTGLVRAISFSASNTQRVIRYHGHPKTVASGITASELRMGVDETVILPNPDAKVYNLEMQSDLTASISFYKELKSALHETSHVPEVATGKVESTGGLSGVALEILYQPILERTHVKQLMYGDMLKELCAALLEIGGYPGQTIELIWPEVLPRDPLAERQAALIDQQLGVSNDTLMTKLGYDPETEAQKKAAQQPSMAEAMLTAFDQNTGDNMPMKPGAPIVEPPDDTEAA